MGTVMMTIDRDSRIRLWLTATVLDDRGNKEDQRCRLALVSLLVHLQ